MCPRRPGLSLSGIKNKFGNGIPYHGATTTNSAPWGGGKPCVFGRRYTKADHITRNLTFLCKNLL